jgi:hypothetical protein
MALSSVKILPSTSHGIDGYCFALQGQSKIVHPAYEKFLEFIGIKPGKEESESIWRTIQSPQMGVLDKQQRLRYRSNDF